jgi:hypothetical protein
MHIDRVTVDSLIVTEVKFSVNNTTQPALVLISVYAE